MSVNKVILLGRLGQDPELKYTPSGLGVCNFSVATSKTWKDKNSGEKHEKTEWHRIVAWGKLAELCNQYLGKGKQVFLEGELQTRSWDDKNGIKRYTTEVLASSVQFLADSKNDGSRPPTPDGPPPGYIEDNSAHGGTNYNSPPPQSQQGDFTADDIPF